MGVGEADALAHEPVEMRRGDLVVRVVGLDVAHAEIVGEDEDDIGRTVRGESGGDRQQVEQ